jgi:putative MATE family efflux protein
VFNAVHTAIPLAIISGAFLTVVGLIVSKPILTLMGTPDGVLDYSAIYMKIYFCGAIPNLIYNFGASILRAAGETKGPLYYLTLSGIVNVALNFLFVKVFNMNVDGVAIATIISQTISAVLVLNALIKRADLIRLDLKAMRIEKESFLGIVKIGLPTGLQSVLFSIANVMIQSSVNTFGPEALAGNSACSNFEGFGYATLHSFYQTTITFIGQNMGAKKYDRIKKVYGLNIACVIGAGIAVAVIYALSAKYLFNIYNVTDPVGISFGLTRVKYVVIPYMLCGLSDITAGAIRAMGSPILPTLNTVGGVCGLRLLMIFTIFNTLRTPESLFITYPVSWSVTFITGFIIYLFVYKKIKRQALLE